jgi:VWFA-related protein
LIGTPAHVRRGPFQRTLAITLALGVATTPLPAFGQQPPVRPLPAFGSDVTLVRISVVVRDKSGGLVRGLKREDFTITEDGRVQGIEAFEIEEVPTDRAVEAPDAAETAEPGPPLLSLGAAKPLAAGTRATTDLGGKRLVVLLFDSSGMEPDQLERSLVSAHEYIDDRMTVADLVAVATIGATGLEIGQDFTANRDLLRRALDRIAGVDDSPSTEATAAEVASSDDPAAADSFTPDSSELDLFNIDRRLRAIEDLSKALLPIVQKKSVLYFSSGMSGVSADNQVELRAAIDSAVKANLSVYPVDTRGLEAVVPGGDARRASRGGSNVFSGRAMARQFDQQAASQDSLAALASDTGGKAFFDSNNFTGAFERVVSDSAAYYVLGYSSTNAARDGRFRRVKVSVRTPDLKVEHRSGYYADRDFKHAGKDDRDRQLQDQLLTDLSATDFPVWIQASHFRTGDNRFYVPLSVAVPGSALFPPAEPGRADLTGKTLSLDLIGIVRDEAKRAVARLRDTVRVNGTADLRRKNVQYRTGFTLPPGKYRLKVVARENQSGTFGSFESDIVVPDLRRNAVKVSSVVFGTQLETSARRDSPNPLSREGSELLPSVTQVVSTRQPLYFYYEVYDPARDAAGAPRLLTSVAFYSGATRRYETPLVEVKQLAASERGAAVFQLSVPANSLKPGFYACQVTLIDDVAGTFTFPRVAVLVRP